MTKILKTYEPLLFCSDMSADEKNPSVVRDFRDYRGFIFEIECEEITQQKCDVAYYKSMSKKINLPGSSNTSKFLIGTVFVIFSYANETTNYTKEMVKKFVEIIEKIKTFFSYIFNHKEKVAVMSSAGVAAFGAGMMVGKKLNGKEAELEEVKIELNNSCNVNLKGKNQSDVIEQILNTVQPQAKNILSNNQSINQKFKDTKSNLEKIKTFFGPKEQFLAVKILERRNERLSEKIAAIEIEKSSFFGSSMTIPFNDFYNRINLLIVTGANDIPHEHVASYNLFLDECINKFALNKMKLTQKLLDFS